MVKKTNNVRFFLLITGMMVYFLLISGSSAEQVYINNIDIDPGDQVTVPILINVTDPTGLGATTIEFIYNSSVVEVIDVNDSDFESLTSYIQNSIGQTNIVVHQSSDSGIGPGIIQFANVTLKSIGNAGDSSLLELNVITLRNNTGHKLIYDVKNGTFSINIIFTVDLYTGWNLISIPVMPKDTSISSVLFPINGNYSIVWAYDASDTLDHWKKYDPNALFGNDLENIEPGKGYWVMVNSDVTLTITGNIPNPADIDLKTGWNLIGYNSLANRPIADALSSINSNYSIVWAYNASDTNDHWKKYDPNLPFGNDLMNMRCGKGYWIKIIFDDIL